MQGGLAELLGVVGALREGGLSEPEERSEALGGGAVLGVLELCLEEGLGLASLAGGEQHEALSELSFGHEGLEHFHGIAGLKVGWDVYLKALLAAPPEDLTVESVLKKHRGVSPNNPYLKPTAMSYTHRIVPSALAERVMQSAKLISNEWVADLRLTQAENEEVWASHEEIVRHKEDFGRATRTPVTYNDQDQPNSPYRGGNYVSNHAAERVCAWFCVLSRSSRQTHVTVPAPTWIEFVPVPGSPADALRADRGGPSAS